MYDGIMQLRVISPLHHSSLPSFSFWCVTVTLWVCSYWRVKAHPSISSLLVSAFSISLTWPRQGLKSNLRDLRRRVVSLMTRKQTCLLALLHPRRR